MQPKRSSVNPKLVVGIILGVPLTATLVIALAFIVFHVSEDPAHPLAATAKATLLSSHGDEIGNVDLTQGAKGVVLSFNVRGLRPGGHAVTVNSFGSCAPTIAASGDHLNPHDDQHGFLHADGPHLGDLPNIYAGSDGSAQADYHAVSLSLGSTEDHAIFHDDGSAIVIYEKSDPYIPGSDVGTRVAFGVIQAN